MTTESPAPALPDHEIPTLSLDELRHLQTQRLRETISAAYDRVPHYRRAFDAKGVTPDDIQTLEDVARLPFLTKADLRENYPFGMLAVPMAEVVRLHASSGTTGRPTVVGYTQQDIDTWADLMARSIRFAGGGPGDIVHVSYGYGLFTGGLGAHYGAERLGATVVPVSGGMTERQVQLIRDFNATVIMVTPSYFLSLLDQMEAEGMDPRSTSLRVGIFGAEPWTESMRREIEERTGGLLVLAAGTLYETLGRLERDGLIRETAAPDEADAGTRWRFYEATPLGHEVLRSEIERLEADLRVARARVPALV